MVGGGVDLGRWTTETTPEHILGSQVDPRAYFQCFPWATVIRGTSLPSGSVMGPGVLSAAAHLGSWLSLDIYGKDKFS